MKLDDLNKEIKKVDIPVPLGVFDFLGVSVFIWKKPEVHLELVETWPYAPDGDVPMLMVQFAWFEIMFYSKPLYRFFYKRKYGRNPSGL